jgi:putative sigma-54 modulation protein
MNVEITGRHMPITPAIRAYVLKRLRRFMRVLPEPMNFHVILGVEKDRHAVEILLKTRRLELTGTGETKDMYSSITRALEKVERQALKQKTRRIEGKRKRAREESVAVRSGSAKQPGAAAGRARRGGAANGAIVEEEAQRKPMALEEALLELGQGERPFVLFWNADSGAVNVLYRRKDGALALIYA